MSVFVFVFGCLFFSICECLASFLFSLPRVRLDFIYLFTFFSSLYVVCFFFLALIRYMFGLVNFLGNLLLALFLMSVTQFCLHMFLLLSVGYCCLFCRIRIFRYVNCRNCRALTPRNEGILFSRNFGQQPWL